MDVIKNLTLAKNNVLKSLNERFPNVGFRAELSDDGEIISIIAEHCTLRGHDDDIYISLECSKGGMAYMKMNFDKINKTMYTLELVNEFNFSQTYFKCYINENDFLILDNNFAVYSEQEFSDQAIEFLLRSLDLCDDPILQKLTMITR